MLETMLKACAAADFTTDPPAFFNALSLSWTMVNKAPTKLAEVLQALLASPQYAHLIKKPQGWSPPHADTSAASDTEDTVPVGPAVATAVVSMGKGRGGASKNKKKVASQRGKGRPVTFGGEDA